MRFLFKLDDSIEVNIRPVILNDEDSEYTTTGIYFGSEAILRIRNMLEQWQGMKEKYGNNEITKEARRPCQQDGRACADSLQQGAG